MAAAIDRGTPVLVMSGPAHLYMPGFVAAVHIGLEGQVRYDVEGLDEACGVRWPACKPDDVIVDRLVAA